jgi:hypothetical protein
VITPLGPKTIAVSEGIGGVVGVVPALASVVAGLVRGPWAALVVGSAGGTTTVSVVSTTVVTVSDGLADIGGGTSMPVPESPPGEIPSLAGLTGSPDSPRFDDDVSSSRVLNDGDLAGLVKGPLLLLKICRLTCRGK